MTVCTKDRREMFGEIIENKMILNEYGNILTLWINRLEGKFGIKIDEWVVMPNHLHVVFCVGAHHDAPKKDRDNEYFRAIRESPLRSGNKRSLLSKILGYLKANVSKNVGKPIWQRNYYEHIIRDEEEHIKIKEYIRMNPEKWCRDMNNPVNYK